MLLESNAERIPGLFNLKDGEPDFLKSVGLWLKSASDAPLSVTSSPIDISMKFSELISPSATRRECRPVKRASS